MQKKLENKSEWEDAIQFIKFKKYSRRVWAIRMDCATWKVGGGHTKEEIAIYLEIVRRFRYIGKYWPRRREGLPEDAKEAS